MDEYFDTEHTRLRDALKRQHEKKSDEFELAVVRLLNLLGIPATWYGKTVDPDRADATAVILSDQSILILLIERVRQKPSEKFSRLASAVRFRPASPNITYFPGDSNYVGDGSPIGLPFQKRFQLSIEAKVRVCIRSR